jgi:competence protein ComGC
MKINYGKTILIVILSALLLMSSVYTLSFPSVCAQQPDLQQQGQNILKNVVGIDLTKYDTTSQQLPQMTYPGFIPQVDIKYVLQSNDKIEYILTFGSVLS